MTIMAPGGGESLDPTRSLLRLSNFFDGSVELLLA